MTRDRPWSVCGCDPRIDIRTGESRIIFCAMHAAAPQLSLDLEDLRQQLLRSVKERERLRARIDLLTPVAQAAKEWDGFGVMKVMHVLTCKECERLEAEALWCPGASVIAQNQLAAGRKIKAALAAWLSASAASPASAPRSAP